jgi:hypothetical protein
LSHAARYVREGATMTIGELVKRIMTAGASSEVVAIVIEAFEDMSRSVTRDLPDNERDKKRKQDRARKQKWREKRRQNGANAEANDAASNPGQQRDQKPDMSPGRGSLRCESSSFLPSLLPEEGKRERKKEATTRARGTRLSLEARLSDADRQFAIENGVRDPESAWAEFRDYWIGVPGQRGTKLDWSATWRNRVRAISSKHGGQNGRGFNGPSGRSSRAAETAVGVAAAFGFDLGQGPDAGRRDDEIPLGRHELDLSPTRRSG